MKFTSELESWVFLITLVLDAIALLVLTFQWKDIHRRFLGAPEMGKTMFLRSLFYVAVIGLYAFIGWTSLVELTMLSWLVLLGIYLYVTYRDTWDY